VARLALDADVVIAFLDAGDDQHEHAISALRPHLTAGEEIVMSASVYAEIMVRPMAQRTDAKVDEFLDAINATVIAIDRPVARLAAQLRARHRSLRLPDALSLATALAADAELLTLDHRLARIEAREKTTS
jgi:predicted nucleic acid-binding protein